MIGRSKMHEMLHDVPNPIHDIKMLLYHQSCKIKTKYDINLILIRLFML